MNETKRKKAVVVGSGVGGVATAARLAYAGFDVSVFEKNDFHGGKCSNIYHEGYRFDRGPSIMLMTEIFEETFKDLGSSMSSEGIDLMKCEPNCHVWFSDGQSFTTSTDLALMNDQLRKFEKGDILQRFISFLEESKQHYDKSLMHVLRKDFPRFLSLLRPAFLPYLFQLHPFQNVWDRVCHFFRSSQLQQGFGLASLYLGMSPLEIPGTYTLLQYAELVGGIWYPKGGFYRIVESLVKIGSALGVRYHLSSEVKEVKVSEGKACGVLLQSGEYFDADVVIMNADLLYAHKELLPKTRTTERVVNRGGKASCSTISFYWSLTSRVPQLATHNMFVEERYGQKYSRVYMESREPPNISFYVHVPSRIDPSASPPGKDAVIALVLVEHMEESYLKQTPFQHQHLDTMVQNARNHVIQSIEARTGISGFKELIQHEIINTPQTWSETFNSAKGSVFGFDHSFFNILSFRPKIKHESLRGLYFVGASVHPGAGVPTCLAGAKLCAERVLRDLDMKIKWATQPELLVDYRGSNLYNPITTLVGGGILLATIAWIVIFLI